MSYAMSKKFSKEPEKFGTGHIEGIVESGAANNSALAGAWIPAMVFGIPGDSITAIVIGVLYMKNMNPGPTLFVDNAAASTRLPAVHPGQPAHAPVRLGSDQACFKQAAAPAAQILMPIILLFCIVGAFAINNSVVRYRHDARLRHPRLADGGERHSRSLRRSLAWCWARCWRSTSSPR
jgi:putative tricarboxylic transport membrane protein